MGTSAPRGTVAWLIEQYLGSLRFRNLSQTRMRQTMHELDWLRDVAGKYPFERMEVRHIEAVMAKKVGPSAANRVRRNLGMLFGFAAAKLGYKGDNPAAHAEKLKTRTEGFHTWTDDEVDSFLARHGPGTKARLVLLLALNTGMARQDLARVGRQHLQCGRIAYRRGKTSVLADLPVLPELAEELRHVPADRMLFVTQDRRDAPYKAESLGNWFRDRCNEAGVPGSLHGLRKAGAMRLALAGASEPEIAAYLGHAGTQQASIYWKAANRGRLADRGFEKLRTATNVSNLAERLDKQKGKSDA